VIPTQAVLTDIAYLFWKLSESKEKQTTCLGGARKRVFVPWEIIFLFHMHY